MDSDQTPNGMVNQVLTRAAQDATFRQALAADPKATLEREFGVQMPGNVTLHVVEETPTTRYLVLPPAPIAPGTDLGDADLENVAGGWTMSSECGSCIATCGCM